MGGPPPLKAATIEELVVARSWAMSNFVEFSEELTLRCEALAEEKTDETVRAVLLMEAARMTALSVIISDEIERVETKAFRPEQPGPE